MFPNFIIREKLATGRWDRREGAGRPGRPPSSAGQLIVMGNGSYRMDVDDVER